MSNFCLGRYALLAACIAAHGPGFACEPDLLDAPPARTEAAPANAQPAVAVAVVAVVAAAPASVPGFGNAAPAGQLEQARGGDIGMAGTATLGGVVSGNSATNVVTGANAITAGSFAGAAGIPIVIQNSGANVLIQNATIINLQFK